MSPRRAASCPRVWRKAAGAAAAAPRAAPLKILAGGARLPRRDLFRRPRARKIGCFRRAAGGRENLGGSLDGGMEEVVYSAESQLRSPGAFAAGIRSDLRVAPSVAWQLFVRRLQAGYRQSWLGYLWLLLPPLATSGAWVYLNSARILDVGRTDLPYPVYVLTGTLLWQVFADALGAPLQQLTAARAILTKSRIPHEAMLLAGVVEVGFNFLVRLAVLVPVLLWFGVRWSPSLLLAPLGVAALLLLGFSIGLLLAPVGLLYQDVSRGLVLATGIWFFLTPVIYPP
ncbi:MAG TPA: hypothetical protein VFQ76_09145, partial [Longimicrobiaceae bacterium]|nr:hypothetical protein [Longimicrobiaceae bacterium]